MDRLHAARPDPAVVLVPGRRGVAVLAGGADRARAAASRCRHCTRSGGRSCSIFLGVFLRSTSSKQTNFTFEDTLSQIGLGYFFLFLLGHVAAAVAVARVRGHSRRLLGRVRGLHAAARTSTHARWA